MTKKSGMAGLGLVGAVCLALVPSAGLSGQEYEALKGVASVKTVFDVRNGSPGSVAAQLDLIHQTLTDSNLTAIAETRDSAVVFIGPAVKLVSEDRDGFSSDDQAALDRIAETVSAIARDGIRLEVCLFAANALAVDPDSFLPEISPVGNGYVSLIGYQANGYSLVPVY